MDDPKGAVPANFNQAGFAVTPGETVGPTVASQIIVEGINHMALSHGFLDPRHGVAALRARLRTGANERRVSTGAVDGRRRRTRSSVNPTGARITALIGRPIISSLFWTGQPKKSAVLQTCRSVLASLASALGWRALGAVQRRALRSIAASDGTSAGEGADAHYLCRSVPCHVTNRSQSSTPKQSFGQFSGKVG